MGVRVRLLCAAAIVSWLAWTPSAQAQRRRGQASAVSPAISCFTIERAQPVPGVADSVIFLADRVRVDPRCELALSPDASTWRGSAPEDTGRARSFLHWLERLGVPTAVPLRALPRTLYARAHSERHGQDDALGWQVILLSHCVDTLLSPSTLVVHTAVGATRCEDALQVRAQTAQCPAPLLLHDQRVDSAQVTVTLPCRGEPSRPLELVSRSEDSAMVVRMGSVSAQAQQTALQQWFADAQVSHDPRALWSLAHDRGAIALRVVREVSANLLDELRLASASGQLVIARGEAIVGPVRFAGEAPTARVVDDVFSALLRRHYGGVGAGLSPTMREAREALLGLSLCLPSRYEASVRPAAVLSATHRCVALERTLGSTGERALVVRARVVRAQWAVSPRGAEPSAWDAAESLDLAGGQSVAQRVLAVGDRVAVERNSPDHLQLFVCDERGCRAGLSGWTLRVHGVTELRAAPDLATAQSVQALTLARWVVIDPWTDWAPIGMQGHARWERGPVWAQLAQESAETFAYIRRENTGDSRVLFGERAARLWGHAYAQGAVSRVLSEDLALGEGATGGGQHARSVLGVRVTEDAACPSEAEGALRGQRAVRPEGLAPNAYFYAHLVQLGRPDEPVRCLARAAFRVWPQRVLAVRGPLLTGVLGGLQGMGSQALVGSRSGWGVGLLLPLVYERARVSPWIEGEVSLGLSASYVIERSVLDRMGPVLAAQMRFAWLTVGVLTHWPTISSDRGVDASVSVSAYAGLDLGAMLDHWRGR
ncbi:MAG: hypothetical protein Q8Q09_20240 [Deltaproteobacteria bacterium]|nr:hypothetical protein [Deltaproteobacteria bacterium]